MFNLFVTHLHVLPFFPYCEHVVRHTLSTCASMKKFNPDWAAYLKSHHLTCSDIAR